MSFLCFADAHAAVKEPVTVLSSTADGFSARVAIDFSKLEWAQATDSLLAGFYTIQVGIPYGATVQLLSARGVAEATFNQIPNVFPNQKLAPMELVKVGRPIVTRGRTTVGVRIYPVQNKTCYQSVEFSLRFVGGEKTYSELQPDGRFDRMYDAAVANHAEAKAWLAPVAQPTADANAVGEFSNSTIWCKAKIGTTGIYRITGAQLNGIGINVTNLRSDSVRVFSGSGLPLPVHNDSARPALEELAIQIQDGGDGFFGANDTLLFFGESVDRYTYSQTGAAHFVSNPYIDQNVYWIAIGGTYVTAPRRMSSVDGTPSGIVDTTITTFTRYAHAGQNTLLRRYYDGEIPEYYTWYWSSDRNFSFFIATPGYITGDTAQLFFYGQTFDTSGTGPQTGFMNMRMNGVSGLNKNCSIDSCYFRSNQLRDGLSTIDLTLFPIAYAPGYFDFVDIRYRSRLTPANNQLDMQFAPFTGIANVQITDNMTGTARVWDVTDGHAPVNVTNFTRSAGTLSYNYALASTAMTRMYTATSAALLAPLSLQQVQPTDLRANSSQTDLLIVTPLNLQNAVNEYVTLKEQEGASVTVATIENIMDNFGWGLYDPTAIRDFLKYSYENYPAPAPSAVLMVGDGSYDYRNYLGTGVPNYVPPYIHPLDASVSDDNYVYFGAYGILDSDTSYVVSGRGYDMMTSRWPVNSSAQVRNVINKIRTYESSTNFGEWRNTITLVADDEFGTFASESFHTIQTEELANAHTPALFNQDKIYLWDFPFVGTEKPSVNDRIVQSINNGTLLINYVGHGNPELWSDEHVFTRSSDLPRLNNAAKLPLVFAASCAIGFYDDPRRVGMAEDLLTMQDNGAVAVVSATRLVYSSPNAQFNQKVFDILLYNDSLSIGEAVYVAKLQRQYASSTPPDPVINDRAYIFLGDPLLQLGMPEYPIVIDQRPDSLQALQLTTVSGHLIDDDSALVTGNGTLYITVYDSKKQRVHTVQQSQQDVTYQVAGSKLYHGSTDITNGAFNVQFILPLDVTFGGTGAKISLYAIVNGHDAGASIDSLPVSGSIAASTDSTGPAITIGFVEAPSFTDGGVIPPTATLQLQITDPSGINLTTGQGHEIMLEVDGDTQNPIPLSSSFSYTAGSYTEGTLVYALSQLSAGEHRIKIKAWDNANNSAVAEVSAEVIAPGNFAIKDLLNYPNPMRERTEFSFFLTQPAREVALEIFTLSGRRINRMLFPGPLEARRYTNVLTWDGRDALAGDRVATGVYIYKATAYPANGGDAVESFGKIVLVN